MKFIIIFGPQAVWKMTVWYELEKITEIPLCHNHATIEPIIPIFGFKTPQFTILVQEFRKRIFEEVAKSELKGLIFTYLWAFDLASEHEYIESISQIFKKEWGEIYFVELEADLNTRLIRNKGPFRLEKKPTKRNKEKSEHNLLSDYKNHRLNSLPWEITYKNYIRINNTELSPEKVAEIIQKEFSL